MKTKCVSVRLESLTKISEKAYKAVAFDGSSDIIPVSQVFGIDYEVTKSTAYWIALWIMEKKSLQFSYKKTAWFDEDGKMLPTYSVRKHIPEIKEAAESNEIESLKR